MSEPESSADERAYEEWCSGDLAAAITTMYAEYYEPARRFVRWRVASVVDTEPEDVVQLAFLKLMRTPFTPSSPSHLRSRFWIIVRTVLVDLAEKDKNRAKREETFYTEVMLPPKRSDTSADPVSAQVLNRQLAEDVLALLPSPKADALWLHFGLGYTHAEVGAILSKTEDATKRMVARARGKARELWDQQNLAVEVVS